MFMAMRRRGQDKAALPLNLRFPCFMLPRMNKKTEEELALYRQKIDEIDGKLINLLLERIAVVGEVGDYKRRTAPGRCPIRPGREAEMVRRIMAEFENSPGNPKFPPAAAAAIWRTIIGASTSVEAPLTISIYAPDRENDLIWMAKEYFGPSIQIVRQPHIKRVIGDVMDGKAAVGIVPMLRSSDTTYWWTNLTQQSNDMPKVFARVPFVYHGTPGRDAPSALAIARLAPENSGDDHTLLVLEADHNVSQSKLQNSLANAKLEASWINIATLVPGARHHLIEIKGFHTIESEQVQGLLSALGASIFNVSFLGSYAVPIIIDNAKPAQDVYAAK